MEREAKLSSLTGIFLILFCFLNVLNRAPETAPIKSKMVYAGTKNDLKKALVGLSIEIQGTDLAEVDEKEVLLKLQQVSKWKC